MSRSPSPLAASVVEILASEGDTVAAGASLLILSAMKMETALHALRDGTVD